LHFLLAWSLFESKCCKGCLRAEELSAIAQTFIQERFRHEDIYRIAEHFHKRYKEDPRKLDQLIHGVKTPRAVVGHLKECLSKPYDSLQPEEVVFLTLTVVYRYRNNMFHGNKRIHTWLNYRTQIELCTQAIQAFVSHAEGKRPSLAAA
jgi:hypothetical protein